MRLYDRLSKCPKCGEDGARSMICNGGEAIRRTCLNCRHVWYELPLDLADRSKP